MANIGKIVQVIGPVLDVMAALAAVEADAVLLPPQAAKLRAIAPAMVAAAIFLNFIIVLLPCSVVLGTCGFLS